MNQELISSKGGAQLLANTAVKTEDAQTLRMVAGAIANLCGNGKFRSLSAVVCVVTPEHKMVCIVELTSVNCLLCIYVEL